jgi:Tfp pilus assembly protein PilZ
MSTSPSVTTSSIKPPSRAALINLDPPTTEVLRETFYQHRITGIPVTGVVEPRLAREKFQAFVVPLNERAAALLEMIRSLPDNKRAVVYGVASRSEDALPFTRHGINALFTLPVDREAAGKIIQSTHALVNGEMRLYVRLPLVTAVRLEVDSSRHAASTREISAGGLAIHTPLKLAIPQNVGLTFTLPGLPEVSLRAVVSWVTEAESLVGVRFAPSEARQRVKKWVEDYLGIVSK